MNFTLDELTDLKSGLGWAYSEGFGGKFHKELMNEILDALKTLGEKVEEWEYKH